MEGHQLFFLGLAVGVAITTLIFWVLLMPYI